MHSPSDLLYISLTPCKDPGAFPPQHSYWPNSPSLYYNSWELLLSPSMAKLAGIRGGLESGESPINSHSNTALAPLTEPMWKTGKERLSIVLLPCRAQGQVQSPQTMHHRTKQQCKGKGTGHDSHCSGRSSWPVALQERLPVTSMRVGVNFISLRLRIRKTIYHLRAEYGSKSTYITLVH